MNKNLLIILVVAFVSALCYSVYAFLGIKSYDEKSSTDKNSKVAVKFAQYIYKFSKENNEKAFFKRFTSVPDEFRPYTWQALKEIKKLNTPCKITTPAVGKAKRYIYYEDDGKKYCFTVSLIKKKWKLKSISQVDK